MMRGLTGGPALVQPNMIMHGYVLYMITCMCITYIYIYIKRERERDPCVRSRPGEDSGQPRPRQPEADELREGPRWEDYICS